jgi:(2R)-3-sulfolactate dehydrogenase (NADP+)
MPLVSLDVLQDLARRALARAGAHPAMASTTAAALVYAEARGLASHGASRVPQYAVHLANGRADGSAHPAIVRAKGGAILIDAKSGLAFPACALAVEEAIARARDLGVAYAGVTNSHHFGAGRVPPRASGRGRPRRRRDRQLAGCDGGCGRPAPASRDEPDRCDLSRAGAPALVIDLSLSEVARGKVMVAAKEGKPIPLGWALDRDGKPTTDAATALDGSMLPMGGTKGAMLALVVELLAAALTGAAMGFEASSFFVDEGNRPRIGQGFLVIDPDALAGNSVYHARVEALVAAMLEDPGVRLPGERRRALAAAQKSRCHAAGFVACAAAQSCS